MDNLIETTFTFRNTEATDPLRDHTEDKLTRLTKYLFKPAAAHCIFKVEGARHIAEITLNANGARYVGVETSTDMYTSIDGAVDKIRKQLSRQKERTKGHKGE
jgi:ribosome hibernation promoting factor